VPTAPTAGQAVVRAPGPVTLPAGWQAIALDTETELIRPGCLVPDMVCLTAHRQGAQAPTISHARGGAVEAALELMASPTTVLVLQNAPFDLAVLVEAADARGLGERMLRAVFGALDAGRIRDTQVREWLMAIYHGTRKGAPKGHWSLSALSERYLGAKLAKGADTWRLRYGELMTTPLRDWPAEAKEYALRDATTTLQVWQAQQEVAATTGIPLDPEHPGALQDEIRQNRAAFALHLMSAWGIRTDPTAVEALAVSLHQRLAELAPALQASGIVRANGTKDMTTLRAHVEAAYTKAGLEVPKTEKGAVATDKDTLGKVAIFDAALDAVVEHTHAEKVLSTFVTAAWAGTARPIQARFNPLVDSGRTSCSGPNLQNLPRGDGVRQCFVPRPGHVFSSCDYSVLELRTLAQVCVDWGLGSRLREAFLAGRDPHVEFGARLARVPVDVFQAWEHGSPEAKADFKAFRQRAKVLNFGKPGGLGAARLVEYAAGYGLALSLEEAKQLTQEWMTTWPEMRAYFEKVGAMEVGGFIRITQTRSGRVRGGCRYTAACNTMFQGLAADGAKAALTEVTKACYLAAPGSPLEGTRPVVFVHDEIVCEHPREKAAQAAAEVARIMVDVMQKWTPDVPQKVEPALMERWEKKAEPMFDDDGVLIPWTASGQ
jgi:DNA polymerase-1